MEGNQKYQNKYLILWKKHIPIKEYKYILTERKRIRTTEEKINKKVPSVKDRMKLKFTIEM